MALKTVHLFVSPAPDDDDEPGDRIRIKNKCRELFQGLSSNDDVSVQGFFLELKRKLEFNFRIRVSTELVYVGWRGSKNPLDFTRGLGRQIAAEPLARVWKSGHIVIEGDGTVKCSFQLEWPLGLLGKAIKGLGEFSQQVARASYGVAVGAASAAYDMSKAARRWLRDLFDRIHQFIASGQAAEMAKEMAQYACYAISEHASRMSRMMGRAYMDGMQGVIHVMLLQRLLAWSMGPGMYMDLASLVWGSRMVRTVVYNTAMYITIATFVQNSFRRRQE